jgi:hypothetical protein
MSIEGNSLSIVAVGLDAFCTSIDKACCRGGPIFQVLDCLLDAGLENNKSQFYGSKIVSLVGLSLASSASNEMLWHSDTILLWRNFLVLLLF